MTHTLAKNMVKINKNRHLHNSPYGTQNNFEFIKDISQEIYRILMFWAWQKLYHTGVMTLKIQNK